MGLHAMTLADFIRCPFISKTWQCTMIVPYSNARACAMAFVPEELDAMDSAPGWSLQGTVVMGQQRQGLRPEEEPQRIKHSIHYSVCMKIRIFLCKRDYHHYIKHWQNGKNEFIWKDCNCRLYLESSMTELLVQVYCCSIDRIVPSTTQAK